ncbi:hypothetical protein HPB51_021934 [Rhipicephalus microplus]|uniref:Uncharacterized protein n=1 Tax=Rhipicephalus microplus TaxID=6941 RepID=A0A9J6EPY4_RHIMP|nr:hypothetical protein HPB51_021934 [Rhipicephalus microplus]
MRVKRSRPTGVLTELGRVHCSRTLYGGPHIEDLITDVNERASDDTPDGHDDSDVVKLPEAKTDADGWTEVTQWKKNRKARCNDEPSLGSQTETRSCKGGIVKKILRTSKVPRLPKGDTKVIMRPRSGLNLHKAGGVAFDKTIWRTSINVEETITICHNYTQNILVASTPDEKTAGKSARFR